MTTRYDTREPTALQAMLKEYEFIRPGNIGTLGELRHRVTEELFTYKKITKSSHTFNKGHTTEEEIASVKDFDHPHICQPVAYFEDEATIWLILRGGELTFLSTIVEHEPLDEQEARQVAFGICLAVRYLHAKGVTEVDLTPQNIVRVDPKLPTFGILDPSVASLAESSLYLATRFRLDPYVPPETLDSSDHVRPLAHSWSIGAIIEFALTGSELPSASRLARLKLSDECMDWVHSMSVNEPERRMTVQQALAHPWLLGHAQRTTFADRPPRAGSLPVTDSRLDSTILIQTPSEPQVQALSRRPSGIQERRSGRRSTPYNIRDRR